MKRGASNHPKMLKLARLLGVNRKQAIGTMTLLWEWAGEYAVRGDIGKHSDEEIALACDEPAENGAQLVRALVESGFVDVCADHRLVIHDWADHIESFIRKRLERAKLEVATVRQPTAAIVRRRQPTAASRVVRDTDRAGQGKAEGGVGETPPPNVSPNGVHKPEYTPEFEAAWDAYGRKGAKRAASREFIEAVKRVRARAQPPPDVAGWLSERAGLYRAIHDQHNLPKFRKDFERWLKDGLYDFDEAALRASSETAEQRKKRENEAKWAQLDEVTHAVEH